MPVTVANDVSWFVSVVALSVGGTILILYVLKRWFR